jgi:carbonic anhydrase
MNMQKLVAGYKKFREEVYPKHSHRFKSLADKQKPHTLFITCSDSRIVPDMIMQTEPGELFICRVVGNLVPAHGSAMGGVSAAIEYAVMVLGVQHIVVCGHSDCGAMRAFLHPEKLEQLSAVRAWLEHANTAIAMAKEVHSHLNENEFFEALTRENVICQLQHLKTHPCVASRLRAGKLEIHGWHYDIGTGVVTRYDEQSQRFVPLEEGVESKLEPALAASSEPH